MCNVTSPTIAELNTAIAATGPGVPRLQEVTTSSDTVALCKTTIAPLALVHAMLGSPFLNPINAWNIIYARAAYLGLECRVIPLLHWIQAQMSAHAKTIYALSSANLADASLQSRKDLRDRITPPPPPSQMHTPVKFIHQIPEAEAAPPAAKKSISVKDMWGEMLNILIRLCNVTEAADLPPIWGVIPPLSQDRDILAMEAECRWTTEHPRFRSPCISHDVAVLALGPAFYYEDLDGVVNAINVFLFPNFSPSAG